MQLQNYSNYKNFLRTILTLDKLFYLLWVIKEDIIHFLLFAIPKQTYDFKVQKGQERIAITGGACGSFSHHESKVLETGESSDCTAVQCKTLLMKMATSHV